MIQRPILRVAIKPAVSKRNSFLPRFAASLAENGLRVSHFWWNPLALMRSDVLILHWPDDFFQAGNLPRRVKAFIQLAMLVAAHRLRRTRIIWVAHNVVPHDSRPAPVSTKIFMNLLDGVIYLSAASREAAQARYPLTRGKPELVTVHGNYLHDMKTPPTPMPAVQGAARLAFVGQIRPYKGIEELAMATAEMKEVSLSISGMATDGALTARLKALAEKAPNIAVDAAPDPLPDAVIERAIDDAHAVVLPYRDITNSGAAFLALSRNRPVMAPRLGSLPEVQAVVGSDWLYLYDGEFTPAVLKDFVAWLRARRASPAPDLSAYGWGPIGRAVSGFIYSLADQKIKKSG